MSVFKACDIRGLAGSELDEPLARRIGRSLGGLLRAAHQTAICVGGDFRRSTPALKQALIDGLLDQGLEVYDVGQVPTPVVYFAGRLRQCPNVAVVTASHNPGRYNGVKFLIAGQPAVPLLIRQVEAGLDTPPLATTRGTVQRWDVVPAYEQWLAATADALVAPAVPHGAPKRAATEAAYLGGAGSRRATIVVDPMAGATTELAPRVLAAAGYAVSTLSDRADPDFSARAPDPSQDAHLETLCRRVTEQRAPLGFALDGDGDRVIFVDGRGRIVRPEQIAIVLIRTCFQRPTVVYDLKCASVLPRAVVEAGGTPVMSPSGHGFIKAAMLERQADLGVEVSGHHFFGAVGGGDDGLLMGLLICRLVTAGGPSLEQLLAPIEWPAITPDLRLPFVGDPAAALETIAGRCGGRVTRLDGVQAAYDGGWALARGSITEPALTLRFEGRDAAHVREIATRFLAAVPDLCQQTVGLIDRWRES